ncbi:hypothetical protein L596_013814 [Steinernema carpocapsae]|uniref:Uncharacterized protein n=1 Tax=Steinernema carpocapsae TaxID=34508 RepID=A0A4U5P273_STECR|nr:hypothetical protein L596_013814 [Steinernema carpocapsae]
MESIAKISILSRDLEIGSSTLNCVPGCACDTALDRIQYDGSCNNLKKYESDSNCLKGTTFNNSAQDCIRALCVKFNRVKPNCCSKH